MQQLTRRVPDRAPRRWTRALSRPLAGLLAAGLMVGVLAAAGPADAKVYPSKKQVQAAKAAAASKAGQVKGIEAKLNAANTALSNAQDKAESAAEAYNAAMIVLQQRTAAATQAKTASDAATAKAAGAHAEIGQLAAQAYMSGGLSGFAAIVDAQGPQQVLDRADGLQVIGDLRQQTFATASQTQVVAKLLQQQAQVALARQQSAAAAAASAKNAAEAQAVDAQNQATAVAHEKTTLIAQLAHLQKVSIKVAQERAAGIAAAKAAAAARAARLAAERAAAAAAHKNGGSGGGGSTAGGGGGISVGSSAAGRIAVDFARAQLGKWYEWAAAGPSRFDCSGLTMRAWQAAGVYLPHYSVAQYADTAHVPVGDARPGDLVFYAYNTSDPGSIHHVAIYIGGGMMIEAPHTGAQVRISSIWRPGLMAYAGRP